MNKLQLELVFDDHVYNWAEKKTISHVITTTRIDIIIYFSIIYLYNVNGNNE